MTFLIFKILGLRYKGLSKMKTLILKNWLSMQKKLVSSKAKVASSKPSSLAPATSVQMLPPKFKQEFIEPFYVVMTHHTAKARPGKGSSWPPKAIPYGEWHIRSPVSTCLIHSHTLDLISGRPLVVHIIY